MTTSTIEKPKWAGEDWLSKILNVLIATRPIYQLMKLQARKVLIKTAEKNGIAWRNNLSNLEQDTIKALKARINNEAIAYPEYYQQPFHAYDEGNLCWLAAFEAEPATYSMALRVWPQEQLTWQDAQARLRSSFHEILAAQGPQSVTRVLDVGCSVGISTRSLHDFYVQHQSQPPQIIGLDLSSYMLSVAKFRDEQQAIADWIHAPAEHTGLEPQSFNLITLQFVIHELPQHATESIFREQLRLLQPGGCLAIVDNNPQSKVIQNLPPALFTLMKSTEPWTDEYYTLNVEALLAKVGFCKVVTQESDPRHRTILAFKPESSSSS